MAIQPVACEVTRIGPASLVVAFSVLMQQSVSASTGNAIFHLKVFLNHGIIGDNQVSCTKFQLEDHLRAQVKSLF